MATDVVIIGGGMIGASVAWWLTHLGFDGQITVVERDPSFEHASTTHTNSCIRQQFGSAINIKASQFGVEFINKFRDFMGSDAPEIPIRSFGYLYLADTQEFADILTDAQRLQSSLGAATRLISADALKEQFPFFNLDGIILGSHNPVNEGYFDGGTIFDWFRKAAREAGVSFLKDEVVGLRRSGNRIEAVMTRNSGDLPCGVAVNAAGPNAAPIAHMAGIELPVEPRKRFTFVFDAAEPLPCDLPLTIDPSGVHMRSDGAYYMAGCPPDEDGPDDPNDFDIPHDIWMDKVWPAIATRVPAFERVKVIREWAGHYAYNTLDQNALLGPHPAIDNFLFANGFSGHGLQQAPAVGRGLAEWIIHGQWHSLDLSPLSVSRIIENRKLQERAVI